MGEEWLAERAKDPQSNRIAVAYLDNYDWTYPWTTAMAYKQQQRTDYGARGLSLSNEKSQVLSQPKGGPPILEPRASDAPPPSCQSFSPYLQRCYSIYCCVAALSLSSPLEPPCSHLVIAKRVERASDQAPPPGGRCRRSASVFGTSRRRI